MNKRQTKGRLFAPVEPHWPSWLPLRRTVYDAAEQKVSGARATVLLAGSTSRGVLVSKSEQEHDEKRAKPSQNKESISVHVFSLFFLVFGAVRSKTVLPETSCGQVWPANNKCHLSS